LSTIERSIVYAERGRIARALVRFGGSALLDDYLEAMADAGAFNAEHPSVAIPKAYKILKFYPAACSECAGEGVRSRGFTTGITGYVEIGGVMCPECEGSGFAGLIGIGESARVKVDSPSTLPR